MAQDDDAVWHATAVHPFIGLSLHAQAHAETAVRIRARIESRVSILWRVDWQKDGSGVPKIKKMTSDAVLVFPLQAMLGVPKVLGSTQRRRAKHPTLVARASDSVYWQS
jgi:hypothetical protein